MNIKGLTLSQFEAVTAGISAAIYSNNVQVHRDAHTRGALTIARLDVRDSRGLGARRSRSLRRGPYACWHAYRDVLGACFWVNPEAVIRTGMAVYRGRDGFTRDFPATGRVNVGSMMAPVTMPELCDHGSIDWHGGGVEPQFRVARDVPTPRRRPTRVPPYVPAPDDRPDYEWESVIAAADRVNAEADLLLIDGGQRPEPDPDRVPSAWDKLVGIY
jgi:hypothetical protein